MVQKMQIPCQRVSQRRLIVAELWLEEKMQNYKNTLQIFWRS